MVNIEEKHRTFSTTSNNNLIMKTKEVIFAVTTCVAVSQLPCGVNNYRMNYEITRPNSVSISNFENNNQNIRIVQAKSEKYNLMEDIFGGMRYCTKEENDDLTKDFFSNIKVIEGISFI